MVAHDNIVYNNITSQRSIHTQRYFYPRLPLETNIGSAQVATIASPSLSTGHIQPGVLVTSTSSHPSDVLIRPTSRPVQAESTERRESPTVSSSLP
jgi:hypothetical protein